VVWELLSILAMEKVLTKAGLYATLAARAAFMEVRRPAGKENDTLVHRLCVVATIFSHSDNRNHN
jgi:hypothetical protein